MQNEVRLLLVTYIEEFTVENLEATIIKAIEKQEKAEGISVVTYTEQKSMQQTEELDYEKLMNTITQIGFELQQQGKLEYFILTKSICESSWIVKRRDNT